MRKCDRCNGNMVPGIALNSALDERHLNAFQVWGNAETLDFMPVLKCQDCGRSLSQRELDNG